MKTISAIVLLFMVPVFLFSQTSNERNYRDYLFRLSEYNFKKNYNSKKNLYIDNNVVHIFIDDNGDLIETGIPTTATERYSYKVILITEADIANSTRFSFSYEGKYSPTFNVYNGTPNDAKEAPASDPSGNDNDEVKIIDFPFATVGPFTDDFSLIVKKDSGSGEEEILNAKINVAKLYHVSISTGLFMTTLENPSNIRESTNLDGEKTLIADDRNTRGIVSLNAVFYPKGRSFLFPPSGGLFNPERFGVLVGTQLNKDQFENFFGGIQFDFARGGSVAFGAHYGRRTVIAGYDDFEFGSEIFEGDINTDVIKEWDIGFFIGANLDLRIFGQLFKAVN